MMACNTRAMPPSAVRFILNNGETLSLVEDEIGQVYGLLRKLAPRPGSVETASVIHGAWRSDFRVAPIDLNNQQSAALREAISLLGPYRHPGKAA
jgi:hypothetical protein